MLNKIKKLLCLVAITFIYLAISNGTVEANTYYFHSLYEYPTGNTWYIGGQGHLGQYYSTLSDAINGVIRPQHTVISNVLN